jgi:hypothetical protein
VTYALEFVAQEPAMFGDRATSAIHRLGKLSSVPA